MRQNPNDTERSFTKPTGRILKERDAIANGVDAKRCVAMLKHLLLRKQTNIHKFQSTIHNQIFAPHASTQKLQLEQRSVQRMKTLQIV